MSNKKIQITDMSLIVAAAAKLLTDCDNQEDLAESLGIPVSDVVAASERISEANESEGSVMLSGRMKDWLKNEDPESCGPENDREYDLEIDLGSGDQIYIDVTPVDYDPVSSSSLARMVIEINKGVPAFHTGCFEGDDNLIHAHWTENGIYLSPDSTLVDLTQGEDPLYNEPRSILVSHTVPF